VLAIENAVSKFSLGVGRNRFARVGISVGTATFGIHGETLDQLVVAADNEMYRMKSKHRSGPHYAEAAQHPQITQTSV
jgi:GGDEF domain-containing protein